MRIRKKVITMLTSVAVFISSASGMTANALYSVVIDAPSGYTEVDDGGIAKWMAWNGEDYLPYTIYQKEGNVSPNLYIMLSYKFNFTGLAIPTDSYDVYEEIYEKYADQLDFEYVQSYTTTPEPSFYDETYSDCIDVRMYDVHDVNGNYSKNFEDFENKKNILIQMCAELEEANALMGTFYCPVVATGQHGTYNQTVLVWNISDGESENLAEIISNYDADVTISLGIPEDTLVSSIPDDAVVYTIADVENFGDVALLQTAIQEVYPDAEVAASQLYFNDLAETASSEAIDLLTAEPDVETTEIGDVDEDGDITLNDAYLTLLAYANMQVGLDADLTDAQMTAADVNGDGDVTIDDAYLILRYYAKEQVGLTPDWETLLETD